MSMILSWALFPLALAAVGLGWGALVEWAAGERTLGALAIPLGLAAALAVAGLLTAWDVTAQAAAPVAAAGALVGLARAWRRTSVPVPAIVAAIGALLIYGAPVILSGEATFLGYVRLDDTSTWLGMTDQLFAHGRSISALDPASTFTLLMSTNLSGGYPAGSFMLLGIGHWITGIDGAWIFQPFLAVCAAALALCCYELTAPVLASSWLRAFVAFIAAQSALLFGYAAWGGIKELTAAFLLALCVALSVRLIMRERIGPRASISLAVAVAALIVTLGAGAAVYIVPLAVVVYSVLVWRGASQLAWGGRTWSARLLTVAAWDLVAALNVAGVVLATSLLSTSTLGFATPAHARLAAGVLLALDYGLSQWLPGLQRPLQEQRRALGAAVVAVAAVLLAVLGSGATLYIALGGLAALALLALPPLPTLARFLTTEGGAAVALPVAGTLAIPAWLTLQTYVASNQVFASATANHETAYGNLTSALRFDQLTGIWLDGDFRTFPTAPSPQWINYLLIWLVFAGAAVAIGWTLWRRRSWGIGLFLAVALLSLAYLSLRGSVPWVMGKSMAFSSPAVLLAGLTGGAILFGHERRLPLLAGVVILGAIAGGVIWSNWLQYHNVTLAPRARLAELQEIGTMLDGKGPTFFNEYEIYGDRHFLRAGSPIEPAEYRPLNLPTLGNAYLTDAAWADTDSFGLAVYAPYRSLVLRNSPVQSEPSTMFGYKPVWQGRYYSLWQQPAQAAQRVVVHMGLGDTLSDAYCGNASNASSSSLCPIQPAQAPSCSAVQALARTAAADHGELVAYQRIDPLVIRAIDTVHDPLDWYTSGPELSPAVTGATATWQLDLAHAISGWQLWLGGSFQRGFDVTVDGRAIGGVGNELDPIGAYEQVGVPLTLAAGSHTITVRNHGATLYPGSADTEAYYTVLFAIALSPPASTGRYVTVTPQAAGTLCGRTLDWIEVVAPS
jgi:hypothetical protein